MNEQVNLFVLRGSFAFTTSSRIRRTARLQQVLLRRLLLLLLLLPVSSSGKTFCPTSV
jgi:hypothetical protein